jgi:hypothetical protein
MNTQTEKSQVQTKPLNSPMRNSQNFQDYVTTEMKPKDPESANKGYEESDSPVGKLKPASLI